MVTKTKLVQNGEIKQERRGQDRVGHEQEVQGVVHQVRVLPGDVQHLEDVPQSRQAGPSRRHQEQMDGMYSL